MGYGFGTWEVEGEGLGGEGWEEVVESLGYVGELEGSAKWKKKASKVSRRLSKKEKEIRGGVREQVASEFDRGSASRGS